MKPPGIPDQVILYLEFLQLRSARCRALPSQTLRRGVEGPQLPAASEIPAGTRQGKPQTQFTHLRNGHPCAACLGPSEGGGASRDGGPGRWPGGGLE